MPASGRWFHGIGRLIELKNAARRDAPESHIDQRKDIAFQAAFPINPRLGIKTAHKVGRKVPPHQHPCVLPRHRTLADEIDGIGYLRVAEAHTRRTTDLDPQMDAAQRARFYHAAVRCEAKREIDVLLPAVKWKVLIEQEPVTSDGFQSKAHVATVGAVEVDKRRVGGHRSRSGPDDLKPPVAA